MTTREIWGRFSTFFAGIAIGCLVGPVVSTFNLPSPMVLLGMLMALSISFYCAVKAEDTQRIPR